MAGVDEVLEEAAFIGTVEVGIAAEFFLGGPPGRERSV